MVINAKLGNLYPKPDGRAVLFAVAKLLVLGFWRRRTTNYTDFHDQYVKCPFTQGCAF